MKANIVIRMSAAHWDANVRTPAGFVSFDLRRMTKENRRKFTRELVKAFRESRLG